jgi:uncharacterized protein (TIGR02246 family)
MTDNETSAVRDVLQRSYKAWAAADAEAFADLYTEDATVVLRGTFLRGRDAVRDYMTGAFAGRLKGSQGVDEPLDVRVVGGHTAIVVSEAGVRMPGEHSVPAERQVVATWVLSKEDGQWLVTAYANTPAQ